MKLIHSDTLRSLPPEVKELIRDGVYALYVVDRPGASYMLVTDRGEIYLVSNGGTIAPGPNGCDVQSMSPKEAVAFSDANPYGSAHVNVA